MAQQIITAGLDEGQVEYVLNRADAKLAQCQLGSRVKNQAYSLKYAAEHTWAGGAATTDTHTLTDSTVALETTDVIAVNVLDDPAAVCVKGVRASATTITLTTGVATVDGKKYQILVFHKVVSE